MSSLFEYSREWRDNKQFFEPESHAGHFTSSDFLIAQWDVAENEEKLRCSLMSKSFDWREAMEGKKLLESSWNFAQQRELEKLKSSRDHQVGSSLKLESIFQLSKLVLLFITTQTCCNPTTQSCWIDCRAGFFCIARNPSDINKFRSPLSRSTVLMCCASLFFLSKLNKNEWEDKKASRDSLHLINNCHALNYGCRRSQLGFAGRRHAG